jgi:DUF3017 family protein
LKHAAPGSARLLVSRREAGRRRVARRRTGGWPAQQVQAIGSADASLIRQGAPASPAPASPAPASPAPAPARKGDRIRLAELPYLFVLACTAASLAVIRLGAQYVKSGTLVLAGVLLIAATARLVLPDRRAGMLSSRRRLVDVAIFATLGVGLLVAGLVVHVAT